LTPGKDETPVGRKSNAEDRVLGEPTAVNQAFLGSPGLDVPQPDFLSDTTGENSAVRRKS
jgi:hypothetical protein